MLHLVHHNSFTANADIVVPNVLRCTLTSKTLATRLTKAITIPFRKVLYGRWQPIVSNERTNYDTAHDRQHKIGFLSP